MKLTRFIAYSIVSLCFLLAACDTASPTAQSAAATPTLVSTDTPVPEPEPTNTPEPPAPEPATNADTPAEPTATLEEASPDPEPTPTPVPVEAVDWLSVEGKTDQGYTYRGNPDAAITVTDFSDFM